MSEDEEENHLIAERRAKLGELRSRGIAYPNDFRRDALAEQIHSAYALRDAAWLEANPVRVHVAGRMLFKRVMGKASFAKIADASGQLQLYLQANTLGEAYEAFKSYDVGDILGAEGELFRTRTDELSVRVARLTLLAKSLRPLPDKWHGLADVETGWRTRSCAIGAATSTSSSTSAAARSSGCARASCATCVIIWMRSGSWKSRHR